VGGTGNGRVVVVGGHVQTLRNEIACGVVVGKVTRPFVHSVHRQAIVGHRPGSPPGSVINLARPAPTGRPNGNGNGAGGERYARILLAAPYVVTVGMRSVKESRLSGEQGNSTVVSESRIECPPSFNAHRGFGHHVVHRKRRPTRQCHRTATCQSTPPPMLPVNTRLGIGGNHPPSPSQALVSRHVTRRHTRTVVFTARVGCYGRCVVANT